MRGGSGSELRTCLSLGGSVVDGFVRAGIDSSKRSGKRLGCRKITSFTQSWVMLIRGDM